MGTTLKFGEVDAILAELNHVPSAGRSAFAARLKNLHRLGFPRGIGSGRGRAANYRASDLVQMALAIEMSQFGILPERLIAWIHDDFYPVLMAIMMGSREAVRVPDKGFEAVADDAADRPFSMFLYFDPCSVAPWSDDGDDDWGAATFFYGGEGTVREYFASWTTGFTPRLSLLNVTSMMWSLSKFMPDPKAFLTEVAEWADNEITKDDFDLDHWLGSASASVLHTIDTGYVETMQRGLPVGQILKRLEVDFEIIGRVKQGDPASGEPDLFVYLPGQRVLSVDFALSSAAEKSPQDIRDRVAYLATRPFQTMFSDNTKFTAMYVEHDDLVRAIDQDRAILGDAYEQGILIVTRATLQALLVGAEIVWNEAKKGGSNGDR
jgi:hypothetical protein